MEYKNSENTENNRARPPRIYTISAVMFIVVSVLYCCVMFFVFGDGGDIRQRGRIRELERKFETIQEKVDLDQRMKVLEEKIDDIKRELEELKQK